MKHKANKYNFLILASAVCLFIFYLACERDFSAINKNPKPPPSNGPDTTSHNFTWRLDTLGTNWSILLDVAVINENEIWAVGEIHTAETDTFDSLGNWVPPYNAAHWNGQEWELKRIKTNACGGVDYPPIQAVFSFAADDILFAHIDGSITHYNGTTFINDCSLITELNGSANKMWGTSRNDLYVVSGNGFIAHYDGSWQKLNSGTTVDIQDIWGAMNPQSGEWEILAVASFSVGVPQAKKLLRIEGTTVSTVQDSGLPLALETIWFAPGKEYFIGGGGGGAGIYHTNDITKGWKADTRQPVFYMFSIRGLGVNDMLMAGGHGYVSHYNGSTSRLYTGAELPEFFGNYYSVAVHPNVVVAVGSYGGRKGVVAVGRRSTQP